MKVMTIVGTRPELIRLSRVIHRLDATVDHVLVHTGQNYDYALNEVFFNDLAIRKPDHMLGVDTSSLGAVLGGTLIAAEKVMLEERPDAVLVLGDTNSCIAAVMAKRLRIPTYHMEAGNRCFDENVPEETNRRLVDHVADFNLVYTEHGRRNLLAEGLHPRRILKTGSPMREVLDAYRDEILASTALAQFGLTEGGYFLVSAHREENVDSPMRLRMLVESLIAVRNTFDLPVFVSTHPRTRKRLEALTNWTAPEGVTFSEPLGFHDYNKLQLSAACCLSDSGTIAEESTLLSFPAVTLRDSIERPEALDSGGIIMTGLNSTDCVRAVSIVMAATYTRGSISARTPEDYLIDNCSERAVNFILSTANRHRAWSGVRSEHDTHAIDAQPELQEESPQMSRSMRICIFTTVHPYDDVRVYSKFVSSWLDEGDEITWIGPEVAAFTSAASRDPRMTFIPIPMAPGIVGRVRAWGRARRILSEAAPFDWVYCPDPDAAALALTVGTTRKSLFFDIHEEFHANPRIAALPSVISPAARKLIRWGVRSVAKRSQLVTTVNTPLVEAYSANPTSTAVIYNSPPESFARAVGHRYTKMPPPMRFFHGKTSSINGTSVVLEALSFLEKGNATVIMFPWSDAQKVGMYDTTLFERVDGLGLRDAIEFADPVAHTLMPEIMGSTHVGLIGYGRALGATSLPNRFFEYMALGKAVIVPTYSPLMKEIVDRHSIGLCVDFENALAVRDAIKWMTLNPSAVARMGTNAALAYQNSYSWKLAFNRVRMEMLARLE